MTIGISLGWNCSAAMEGVTLGLRKTKTDGYRTCPFDEAITNYKGVVECIRTDFTHFFDLTFKTISSDSLYCTSDTLIYNPQYKFLFNHESPGHANLWQTQGWPGGKEHFISQNFLKFRERYERRIAAFRDYLQSGESIQFLITLPSSNLLDLHEVLQDKYPDLTYSIHQTTINPSLDIQNYKAHLAMMEAEE
jgi:hypothetical protein